MGQAYPIDRHVSYEVNGTRLSVRIRGTNEQNPIVLFLHGGPGICNRHFVYKYHSNLADVCTLVCLDQRGSGKSYTGEQAKQPMTIDLVVEDARQIVEKVCSELKQDKLIVVGHSWGSVLGTLLVQRHPEHIKAYIGMGQLANGVENETLSYEFVWNVAVERADKKALQDLARIGAPVNGMYRSIDDLTVQRNYMTKYGGGSYRKPESIWTSMILPLLSTPEYSILDLPRFAKGAFYNLRALWSEVVAIDFCESVKKLEVPVFITQGDHDQNTPTELARRFYDALEAPKKRWYAFAESAHSPFMEEPEKWGEALRDILTQL